MRLQSARSLTELQMQLSLQARELRERNAALEAAAKTTVRWAAEKQALTTDLAATGSGTSRLKNRSVAESEGQNSMADNQHFLAKKS